MYVTEVYPAILHTMGAGVGVGVVGSGRLELERAFKPLGAGIAGGLLVN